MNHYIIIIVITKMDINSKTTLDLSNFIENEQHLNNDKSVSKHTIHLSHSQTLNLTEFKANIAESRINLNVPILNDQSNSLLLSPKYQLSSNSMISNSNSQDYELPLGLQVYIIPGEEYFNMSSQYDYMINLTVNENNTTNNTKNSISKAVVEMTVNYKFPDS